MTDSAFNRINIEIKRAYYTFQRYKSESTFVLLYHEKELSLEQLALYVRISDQFVRMDKNHYFINFAFTSEKDAFKASQNLLLYLDNYFNDRTTCIAIDTFNIMNSAQAVLSRLTQVLKETKKNSDVRIENDDILNGQI